MTKVYSRIPPTPHQLKNLEFFLCTNLTFPKYPPQFGRLQIWDDQSLLQNTPPNLENFRFGMTKVYSGIPPRFAMYYGSYYMMTSGGFLCILGKLICILGNFNIFPHLLLRQTQAHKEGVTYWYVSFLLVLLALF